MSENKTDSFLNCGCSLGDCQPNPSRRQFIGLRKMTKLNSILAWVAALALMAFGQAAIAGPDNSGEVHDGGNEKDGGDHEEVERDLRLA